MRKWEKNEHKMPREGTEHGLLPDNIRPNERNEGGDIGNRR